MNKIYKVKFITSRGNFTVEVRPISFVQEQKDF